MRMKKWEAVGFPFFCLLVFGGYFIEGRIVRVEVLGIQGVLGDPQGLRKSLVVHYLTLTQELDGILDVGIVGQPQNVVVGHTRLLLC